MPSARVEYRHCLLAIALTLLASVGAAAQAIPTELRIHPVDEAGNAVAVTKAEIYLDFWGGGEKITLPIEAGSVRLPLDRDWLCDQKAALCEDLFVAARLILLADGYAPVASEAFLWMGGVETPGGPPQTSVEIRFMSGAWMPVSQGESKEVTVPFRRPVQRALQFLNAAGEPVPGVQVRISLLLATTNHCGSIEGELLSEGATDELGAITVPDADAQLVFEMTKEHFVLLNPQYADSPMRLTAMYASPVNVVLLRRLEPRPLHLQLTGSQGAAAVSSVPVSGMTLSACLAACPCGACCGSLAESDSVGRIAIEDFYPEEWERLMLLDREGRTVWQSTPRTLVDDPVVIELPKAPPVLTRPVPLGRDR
jgi:hypothetical protein